MDDGLKQRLIGALVLLALAVIFIPVFFDRERIQPVDKATQIPLPPDIERVEIALPELPVVKYEAKPADKMYIPDDSKNETLVIEPDASTYDPEGVPNSWVLQIGSFRFIKHAEEFRDKLIAGGYAAYTRSVSTERGKMTRVYVGPKIDKALLVKQKKEIEAAYKVSAILLKFKP